MQAKTSFTVTLALILGVFAGSAAAEPQGPDGWPPPPPPVSYLGVDTRDVSKDRADALKLKDDSGVEVTMVDQDAPAGKAGVHEHDVIVGYNGQKVDSQEQLRRMVRETPPGRTVSLAIVRDGKSISLSATIGDRRELMRKWEARHMRMMMPPIAAHGIPNHGFVEEHAFPDFPPFGMAETSMHTGVIVENLTPQLAAYFGARSGAGVLVRSVDKGSVADAGGLKAGDLIVRVNKDQVNDINDWRRIMHGRSGKVTVTIVRDHKQKNLTLRIPEYRRRETGKLEREDELEIAMGLEGVEEILPDGEPEMKGHDLVCDMNPWQNRESHRKEFEEVFGKFPGKI